MAVKIIVSDLDGTLMAPDHLTVAEATKAALLRAHDAGMRIAIATGRTLSFTANVTDQIPFVDYVICSNGACAYDRNNKEFIYSKLISPEETAAAVTLLNSLPIYYNIYLEGRIYVQKGSERFFVNPDMPSGFIEKFVASTVQCDDLLERQMCIRDRLIDVFAADPQVKNSVLDNFRSKGYEIASAAPGVNSATAGGVNKGAALLGMCEAMHYALVALHIRLQTAAAYEMLGKRETADELLISALAAAEPDALYLPFVENYRYLKTALTRGAGAKFAAFVRTVTPLGEDFVRRCGEKRAEGSRPAALAGLTERESAIAALVAKRLSNREIAEQLFLSEGSVKQYINQIYSKLLITGDVRTKRKRLAELAAPKS